MAGVSGGRVKKVPAQPRNASFVLGSRPPGLRSPRIRPMVGQTNYGKNPELNPQFTPAAPTQGAGIGNIMNPRGP